MIGLSVAVVHGCDDGPGPDPCGNGIIDRGETCDGSAVATRTCEDEGFPAGGTLSCNATCDGYETAGCFMHRCGNGVDEPTEVCDGTDLGGNTCETLAQGFVGGELGCNEDCGGFDTSACVLPEMGGIEGTLTIDAAVTCDASDPVVDCAGVVFMAVLAEDPQSFPNQVPLATAMLEDLDFAATPSVHYAIAGVPAGTQYLTAFLDDNSSDTGTGHAPDSGDPVVTPLQVTVTADATTQQNVSFSLRFP